MAKYTSDTNLIKGAATAYKNWDNVAGMYAGLDKVTKAGADMMDEAVKGYEAEQARIKKEQEEAKKEEEAAAAEKKRQDREWYNISGKVYENAGSFMKDIEYKDVAGQISSLKERYITAKESGSPEEMAAVMIEFNNLKGNVDDHKAFRETITNPEYGISNAMKHSGVTPGDNGEDHNFLTGLVNEDYKITREGGQTYYNVGGVKKTMKEIKDMTILKDNIPYAAYSKAINDFSKNKNFDRDNTEYHVRNNIVPQETNKLRAFLADDGFGNGETFSQVLNRKGNRASIEKEIMNSVFNTNGGGIDDKEWQNFTNAIVDPKNEFWKGDEEAWKKESTRIATEQLTNGIENKWKANPDNKPDPITTDVDPDKPLFNPNMYYPLGTQGGSSTGGQINGWINDIKTGSSFDFDGNAFDYVDGGWYVNYSDGLGEEEKSTPDSENYIGDAETLIATAFGAGGGDARFNDITTKKIKIIDPRSGEVQDSGDKDEKTSMEKGLVSKYSTPSLRVDMNFMSHDDNYIGSHLNKLLPSVFEKGNEDGYKFEVDKLDGSIFALLGDDPFREAVALKDNDGNVLKYPEGHEYEGKNVVIKTGGNLEERKQAIATLNDILETFKFDKHISASGSTKTAGGGNVRQ